MLKYNDDKAQIIQPKRFVSPQLFIHFSIVSQVRQSWIVAKGRKIDTNQNTVGRKPEFNHDSFAPLPPPRHRPRSAKAIFLQTSN